MLSGLKTRQTLAIAFLVLWVTILWVPRSADALPAPLDFEAFDTPNDGGESLTIVFRPDLSVPERHYFIYMSPDPGGEFRQVAEVIPTAHAKANRRTPWWAGRWSADFTLYQIRSTDTLALENGRSYFLKLVVKEQKESTETEIHSAVPRANLFNFSLLNNFLLMSLFTGTVFLSIAYARKNPNLFLRRIAGLDAVEEAVGRATEMGKPILYLTGSDGMDSLSTIAATVILGEVAKKVARYDTTLKVPHRDPVVMAVCQEIVKEAYLAMGRPDAYKEDSNFFITLDQFSYTAAVDGIMLRERPAAILYMGFYYAESLLLAETGAGTGAIQIAGTDSDTQLPFFVTTCDYTLIGEELYAASAYLSREPVLVGTLRGQDQGKAFLLISMVIGTILATIGAVTGTQAFVPVLQLFRDFK